MSVRAVILDIGGVLEHNPRTGWQDRWAAILELGAGNLEARLLPTFAAGSIGTITLDQVQERIVDELGLDAGQVSALMDEIWREYLGSLNHEMFEYFASLRPRLRTGVLSNSFVGAREREEAAYGFATICDAVLYSHELGLMKPNPEIFRIACRRVGAVPHETVFVDDVQENVDAAAALGLRAIRFESAAQTIAALEAICAPAG